MPLKSQLRIESLEVRSMLAADLGVGEFIPDSPGGGCGVDAGYLQQHQARPVHGDANCDGFFNSADLVQIMQAGEFEDNEPVFYPPADKDGEFKGTRNVENSTWEEGDFDGDNEVTTRDLVFAMKFNTYEEDSGGSRPAWDVNNDGIFNSTDLVAIFQAGEYEDNAPIFAEDGEFKGTQNARNSTAAEGDWNGDLEFTSSDLVLAMQSGQYVP